MKLKEAGNLWLNGFVYGLGLFVALFLVSIIVAYFFNVRLIG